MLTVHVEPTEDNFSLDLMFRSVNINVYFLFCNNVILPKKGHENVPQCCCGAALWNRAKIQINKMAALNDPNFDFFLIVFRLDS